MTVKNSIRKRLVISYIILSISPLLLLGGVLSWQSFVVQKIQIQNLQSEVSKRVANEFIFVIHDLEDDLVKAGNFTNLIRINRDRQYNILSKIYSLKGSVHQEVIHEIALLDSKGKEKTRISSEVVFTTANLGDRSNADEFIVPATMRETYYGPVYFDKVSGIPLFTISIPLIDAGSGTVEGVLVSVINLKLVWELIADIKIGESGVAYILDTNGRVIAHPDPSVVKGTYFEIPEVYGTRKGLQGKKALMTAEKKQFGRQAFYIVTELPVSEALRQTKHSLLIIAAFLVFALSGAFVLGFIIIRRIVRPVESLSRTALSIDAGDI